MKKTLHALSILGGLLLFANTIVVAQGLKERTKTEVTFGFGTFKSEQTTYIQSDKQRTESKSEFKGKGLTGKIAGKFFGNTGDRVEIVKLGEDSIYDIDMKKKKCQMRPITNMADSVEAAMSDLKTMQKSWQQEREKYADARESNIEIIESSFKVEKLGNNADKNGFPCTEFLITSLTKWRDKQSGQTGSNRLSVTAWMTPDSDQLQQAREIKQNFAFAYLEKLGMDTQIDELEDTIFGGKWLEMLKQIEGQSLNVNPEQTSMSDEMQKLQGYHPIDVDGQYFVTAEGGPETEMSDSDAAESTDIQDQASKKISGFAKGLFGGKKEEKDPENTPVLSFKSSTFEQKVMNVKDDLFQSPYECKPMK